MSNTTSKTPKATALARVQAIVAGTNKHFSSGSFTLGNTVYTAAELVKLFESLANAITAVDAAQASAKDAVATLRAEKSTVSPILLAYQRMLLVTYGTATQVLTDFGLQPPKARTPLTSEANAAAAVKRQATRKARGTTSKKQKLAVKGDVTSVVVTPVTRAPASAPAAPAQPTSNASAPSGATK
jgi:hypothetical protein